MAPSLIDILIRTRRQGQNETRSAIDDLKQLDNAAGLLSQGLAGLAAGAGIAGIVALTQQLDELARRGAVFQQLSSVLEDYAATVGSSAQAFVEAGRKASSGTIADYELILNANRAIQFEVAKSADQYAKLIELATALGRAQGISDTQALEFLTTGIARESKLILDNLGLIVDLDSATTAYARTLGKAADQLTQAERKQAILNEAFRQGATAVAANREASDSAATNFERMDAAIRNAKDNLGELFGPAVAVVAKAIADAASAAAAGLKEVGENLNVDQARGQIEALKNDLRLLGEGIARLEGDRGTEFFDDGKLREQRQKRAAVLEELNQTYAEYNAAVTAASDAEGNMIARLNQGRNALAAHGDYLIKNAEAAAEAEAAQRRHETQTLRTGAAMQELYSALEGATPSLYRMAQAALESGEDIDVVAEKVRILRAELNALEAAGSGTRAAIIRAAAGVAGIVGDAQALNLARQQIGDLNFGIAALEQRLKDGSITQVEFDYELARLNETFTGTFDAITEADRAAQSFARRGLADAEKAAQEAERQFESLKNKVAGVLSSALDPGVGVNPDEILEKLGLRPDAINEDARRLADIAVNGFKSPWLEYFQREFPALFQEFFAGAAGDDGIKAQAAQLLKNFQDGLTPEFLDKDTAKERVRRMLIGEARMDELAREIAGELASEFGGVSQENLAALATRALGGSGLFGTGEAAGVARNGESAGFAFANGARSVVVDGALGDQITSALDEQLRSERNLSRLTESGRLSGGAWGAGFLETVGDSVPARLLEILTQLMAPGMEALLIQRQSLQGAR